MCGRYTLTATPEAIQQAFNLGTLPDDLPPRYNIAPTQHVPIITNHAPDVLTIVRWGLIPSWSRDAAAAARMINARAETVDEKPSFRSAFKRRRCLIPADGFFEWTAQQGGRKRPYYIHHVDHAVFAFAGLWELWHSPEGDEVQTCTIITSEPNDLIRPLHNRMAVILDPADYDLWLSPDELPAAALKPLLRPYPAEKMAAYPVSTLVNSPANDTPQTIIPDEPPEQGSML